MQESSGDTSSTANCEAETTITDQESEVAGIVERFLAAVTREDRDGIRAHHANDVLMYDLPYTVRGLAEYDKTWNFFFASRNDAITFAPRDMEVHAGANVAFVTCEVHCVGTTAGPLDFRLTEGLNRRAGHREIPHEHHSLPTTDKRYIPHDMQNGGEN